MSTCEKIDPSKIGISFIQPAANDTITFGVNDAGDKTASFPEFQISLNGVGAGKTEVQWYLDAKHTITPNKGGKWKTFETLMACGKKTNAPSWQVTDASCSPLFVVGSEKAELGVFACGAQKRIPLKIMAANPSESTVALVHGAESVITKIACHESNSRQFCALREAACFANMTRGYPKVSYDDGVGMMQLTDAVLVGRNTAWDWRKNMEMGAALLEKKKMVFLQQYLQSEHLHQGANGAVNTNFQACLAETKQIWKTLVSTGAVTMDGATLEREAVRAYNGGREHMWRPSEGTGRYTNCALGSWVIAPRTNTTREGYTNDVYTCRPKNR